MSRFRHILSQARPLALALLAIAGLALLLALFVSIRDLRKEVASLRLQEAQLSERVGRLADRPPAKEGETVKPADGVMTPAIFREFGSLKLADFDVRSRLKFKTQAEAEARREKIRAFIWRSAAARDSTSLQVETSHGTPLDRIFSARALELWRFTMRHGLQSRAFFLQSAGNKDCLFIFHDGHNFPKIYERPEIVDLAANLTASGCDTILISMPLYGVNETEPITVDGKTISFDFRNELHNGFYPLERPDFSPFQYFVDPVIGALDEALRRRTYSRIGLAGLSGGGWTVDFIAAIEPRLTHLYPLAGDIPFEQDFDPKVAGVNISNRRGDFESGHPEFYNDIAGYFDLYVLGGIYPNRRAIHIYNKHDDCCFPSVLIYGFRRQVEAVIRDMSGNDVRFISDDVARKHELSGASKKLIVDDFLK